MPERAISLSVSSVVDNAAARRCEAARWLRQMEPAAAESLPERPSEEDFCAALRNGLVLCKVLNRVNPGAVPKVRVNEIVERKKTSLLSFRVTVTSFSFLLLPPPKVVENPVITVQTFDGPAQSAIQYFENMRNFLVAVSAMNLLTFETSDIEKVTS